MIDYQVVFKKDNPTYQDKNTIMREMMIRAHQRGFRKIEVLFDSWYANNQNFNCLNQLEFNFTARVRKNRKVIIDGKAYRLNGLKRSIQREVHLIGYAQPVRIHKTDDNCYLITSTHSRRNKTAKRIYKIRWHVEEVNRILKISLSDHCLSSSTSQSTIGSYLSGFTRLSQAIISL